jgi:hypothetical protein
MTKPFTTQVVGHEVTQHIYVKGDGRTVCSETDKDVAELKHVPGERITEAQLARLIFPGAARTESLPDSEQRSASEVPDAANRRSKGK